MPRTGQNFKLHIFSDGDPATARLTTCTFATRKSALDAAKGYAFVSVADCTTGETIFTTWGRA